MANYDIVIHGSKELRDHCEDEYGDRNRAQDRAVTYLEGAGNRLSNHSINAEFIDTDITAPTQEYHVDNTYQAKPCDRIWEYNWLHTWFRDYCSCNGIQEGDDCTFLLTFIDGMLSGGAMSYDTGHSVVITGKYIATLPSSYEPRGTTVGHNGVATLLHEFGHYGMGGVSKSHERADDWYVSPTKAYKTVMGEDLEDGDTNYCSDYLDLRGQEGFELYWDDCCRQEW
ncbi:hypothetical protein [Haloarchaeobius sp. FL176]|uniref:hypothetical protein n=1 Tax=Haloarchaeobius sp. FL176 TaxID=2967129 RepID=UPI00214814B4|nr:hypothetical protein [Haloarchaeobius sp. FL176]